MTTPKPETAKAVPRLFRVTIERSMLVLALSKDDALACAEEYERDNDAEPDRSARMETRVDRDEKDSPAWISDEVKALLDPDEKLPRLPGPRGSRPWEDLTVGEWLDGSALAAIKAASPEPEGPAPDHPGQGRIFPEAS